MEAKVYRILSPTFEFRHKVPDLLHWNRPEEPPTSRRTGRTVRGRSDQRPHLSGESILQVRAALLCDDHRLNKYIHSRPGSPLVRKRSTTPRNHSPYPEHAA